MMLLSLIRRMEIPCVRNFLPIVPAILLVTGCSTVSNEEAFKSVQTNVADLSGHKVTWNQGTADDAKVEAQVKQLLSAPLNVHEAVQIALLNNPDLQATFEDIGISQADLVQAGLLKNPAFAGSSLIFLPVLAISNIRLRTTSSASP